MKLVKNIVSWVFAVLFFLCALGSIPSLGMVLFAIVGIALLPIKPINNLWDKVPKRKIIKPIAAIILFFIASMFMPERITKQVENEVVLESTVEESSNEETTEISLAVAEKTKIESEIQTETQTVIESTVEEVSEEESTTVEDKIEAVETKTETEVKADLVLQTEEKSETVQQPAPEPQPEVMLETVQQPAPEPQPEVKPEPEPAPQPTQAGSYAVNNNANSDGRGKIHIVGKCIATGNGDKAMKNPVYFNSYEEALAYSNQIAPDQDKRNCGRCW